MKLFSTTVIAFLYVSIASGAPSTQNPSFVDITNWRTFAAFDKLNDLFATDSSLVEQFQCFTDTLAQVSEELGLEELWKEAGPNIQTHLNNWKECSNLGNRFAVILCNLKEGFQTYKLITEYIRSAAAQEPKFINRFVNEVNRNCAATNSYDLFKSFRIIDVIAAAEKETDIEANSPLVEQFQCFTDTLAQVSEDLGLEGLWKEAGPNIQKHLNNWKECSSLGNRFAIIFCNLKEGVQTYKLITEYIRTAAAQDPKFISQFAYEVNHNCAGTNLLGLFESFQKDGQL